MEEEEEEEEEKVKVEDEMEKLVCVTGASGNIGSWIVKLLLQRRYNNVRATVRDTSTCFFFVFYNFCFRR